MKQIAPLIPLLLVISSMNPLSKSTAASTVLPRAHFAPHRFWGWALACLGIGASAIWLVAFNGRKDAKSLSEQAQNKRPSASIDFVYPQPGGIDRVSIQPGTVEPFESADLYAKVSGFLIETVDIGKRVEKGQILARLSVPEYEKQVAKDKATVEHTKFHVKQMEAHLAASTAEARATEQLIAQVKTEMKSKAAYRSFRFKQLERIKLLYQDKAVDAKYLDETTDHYEAAFEAENAAREAVTTAQFRWEAAKAKVLQAEADIDDSNAAVDVAKADLDKSNVLLDYAIIRSPYDGVVTKRNFNRGEFIRSADSGGERVPVVAVDCNDVMRVIVQIPDRDVPYVDVGDTATFEIVALPGRPFKGMIARKSNAEDAQTRSMKTEIDISNAEGKLLRNMYGTVNLTLQVGSPTALRIPSAALINKSEGEQAMVRVLRDHRVHLVQVEIGIDTGVEVEVVVGLHLKDQVILRANGPLDEGTEIAETHEFKGAVPH